MSDQTEQRKLAAIMFTDMVGYSALSQRDDKLALELLEEHRRLLREIFPRFHGTEIKTIGDAFLVEFGSALEAAQCAIEIQRTLAKHNADAPADRQIQVRIGVHIGDVVHRGGDVYGDGVNIASRIEQLAGAGGICVSMDVERQIRNALEARFEKLAPTELKNISVTMDLFRIVLPWERQKSEVRSQRSEVRKSSRRNFLPVAVAVALIAAALLGYGIWRSQVGTSLREVPKSKMGRLGEASLPIPEKSIAVLPFESLSRDPENAYFADGIQDEIITKLASIADLKVISRTSTAKYKSKPEDLRTVSQQLGVATALEGTVQKAADKVRVNVQLIDARADSHLWAKSYDRDIKDVFAVESEVAQEIADSLQAKLSPAEANSLATAPTKDAAAYDLFLKGEFEQRVANTSLEAEAFDQAAAWYRQAIERDPNFALAIARLVECRVTRHWFVETLPETDLAEVRRLADRALSIAPDLAAAHVALGLFHYYGYRHYDEALAEFQWAVQRQPNNARATEYSGYVHRRQGQWDKCLAELNHALEQDPRNADVTGNLSETYSLLRMWREAESTSRHALSIDPHSVIAMRALLLTILNGRGDVNEAQGALQTFPASDKVIVLSSTSGVAGLTGDRAYTSVIARNFEVALKVWDTTANTAAGERAQLSARTAIRVLAGDFTDAQAEAEKARALLEERLRHQPNELVSLRQLSWVYLALKRNQDAVRLAGQIVEVLPREKDALLGAANQLGLAEIEARTGATADAVTNLRQLLSVPAGASVTIARLKIDPVWDPIRNDPAFQQLLSGDERVGP